MNAPSTRRSRLILAFTAVYLIWGSTYLAMRIAVETIPPLLMASIRMLSAGGILLGLALVTGAARPERAEWRSAIVIGALLFLGGNGAVVWSAQHAPSGLVAVVVASVPLWLVVLEAIRPEGNRPRPITWLGVAVGLAGIAMLVGPGRMQGGIDPVSATVLVLGSLCWATGSLLSRRLPSPKSPLVATALQMLCGGLWLLAGGLALGEGARFHPAAITTAAWLSLAYLSVFGSIVAFTAYVWLLRNTTPAKAATYAYVNPIIALIIGWAFAGERLTVRVGVAAVVIIGAVALITSAGSPPKAEPEIA
jgi:drug/metabolite transporter (DMT)-like permease